MIWNFTKMQGAGNDFVVLDGVRQSIDMTPERARALADRHFGIGADQILLVEPPQHPEADFRYRIFNSDGGEVEHCGNGARCFVRFVHEQGLSGRNPLRAEICTGLITLTETESGDVTVSMGRTRFDPADVGFDTQGLESRPEGNDTLWTLPLLNNDAAEISLVAISNPHAVQLVDNIDTAPVARTGPQIESHPRFANRVNVGYMQVVDRHTIRLRVFERGAGETLSCGTGACAAAVAGIRRGLLDNPVLVHTRGGPLTITLSDGEVQLSGPAVSVFSGQVNIQALTNSIPFKEAPHS
ncbi:MAG TPA: diaminopimelate epimerase [Pusillimonas sp.]|uniref:diaminopimelate epimerase n=1 Tax=unclassified Pusillimonas TaxID=2640016 RepID=UPI002638E0BA|nr:MULTISPECIES: diaminopimelate epimerase [unclassified Pusillimonas]HLU20063.1 diaminopimelate epimerase [Pusillimonas sp.]